MELVRRFDVEGVGLEPVALHVEEWHIGYPLRPVDRHDIARLANDSVSICPGRTSGQQPAVMTLSAKTRLSPSGSSSVGLRLHELETIPERVGGVHPAVALQGLVVDDLHPSV